MAGFVSQWSCSSHILTSRNHPRTHYHPCTHLRSRGHVCIRVQSMPSEVAEINLEKLQTTSTKSISISITPPTCITYMGVVNTSIEGNLGRSFSVETLNGGEANIAIVAAEAIALAKEALKVAKDAVQFDINSSIPKSYDTDPVNSPSSSDSEDSVLLEGCYVPQVDKFDYKPKFQIDERRQENHEVDDIAEDCEEKNILVRSRRQTERRERRLKAAERAATSHVFVRAGPSRKKHSTLQNVDFSDPLCYLRATTTSTKLLTSNEELELSEGIQSLLKLEKLRDELEERYGNEPTFGQWAAAAGLDQKTLRKHLNHGILCKDRMIKSNIRLVISIAKNYQGAGMNLQDLVQEGCRGLVKGAEKFDASKGFKFSTYAHWWIKQAVRKSLSDQSRTIRLPFHMVDATYRVREARKQLYSENGRHPDDEEVAEATGLSMKKLMSVLLAPKAPRSLDQKIGINQNLKPSEVIASPDAETPEDLLIKQFMKQDIAKALANLNPRERQVIRWRFGMEDGRVKTLQECGELMGVCRERIRQIESSAFRKLKNKKRSKSLRQYLAS